MVEAEFYDEAGQRVLRLAVSYGQPLRHEGNLEAINFQRAVYSESYGRRITWEEDCEEWLRAEIAAYARTSLRVHIIADTPPAPGTAPVRRRKPAKQRTAGHPWLWAFVLLGGCGALGYALSTQHGTAGALGDVLRLPPITLIFGLILVVYGLAHLVIADAQGRAATTLVSVGLFAAMIYVPLIGDEDDLREKIEQRPPLAAQTPAQPTPAEPARPSTQQWRQRPTRQAWRDRRQAMIVRQQMQLEALARSLDCDSKSCFDELMDDAIDVYDSERASVQALVANLHPKSPCTRAAEQYDGVLFEVEGIVADFHEDVMNATSAAVAQQHIERLQADMAEMQAIVLTSYQKTQRACRPRR